MGEQDINKGERGTPDPKRTDTELRSALETAVQRSGLFETDKKIKDHIESFFGYVSLGEEGYIKEMNTKYGEAVAFMKNRYGDTILSTRYSSIPEARRALDNLVDAQGNPIEPVIEEMFQGNENVTWKSLADDTGWKTVVSHVIRFALSSANGPKDIQDALNMHKGKQ